MEGYLDITKFPPGSRLHYLSPSFCAGPYLSLSLKHASMCTCVHSCTDTCRDKDIPYIYQSCLGHLAHFLKIVAPICLPQAISYRCFSAPLRRQKAEVLRAQRIGAQVSITWWDRVYGRFRISMGAQPYFCSGLGPNLVRGEGLWVEQASSTPPPSPGRSASLGAALL